MKHFFIKVVSKKKVSCCYECPHRDNFKSETRPTYSICGLVGNNDRGKIVFNLNKNGLMQECPKW